MRFIKTEIKDVILIEPKVLGDSRGFFMETFNDKLFRENGIAENFVQDNVSRSKQGTLRGLHYQLAPNAQGKLVRVTSGAVYDVAVDIRKNSPTFGKYIGIELSAENKKLLWIPPGFAHGFYVISEEAEFCYKCTAPYSPQSETGILWNDATIDINWPIIANKTILSDKDQNLPSFKNAQYFS